jgi:hypothetical protein
MGIYREGVTVVANITFKELVEAASKLPPAQKAALVQTLQVPTNSNPTREQLIAEMEALRAAGAFDQVVSLRNKYANPSLHDVSDAELRATIHEAATEWEKELDEFCPNED